MTDRLAVTGATVRECRIVNQSLTLMVDTVAGESRLLIEGRLRLRSEDGVEEEADASKPETLGSLARLAGVRINEIRFREDGTLEVALAGHTLTVPPSADFEAWDLSLAGLGRWVCTPGGKIAEWSVGPASVN